MTAGDDRGDTQAGTDSGDVVTTDVPALMAGVRLDRAVSMAANVSRSTAAELIERGPGVGRRRPRPARQGTAQ